MFLRHVAGGQGSSGIACLWRCSGRRGGRCARMRNIRGARLAIKNGMQYLCMQFEVQVSLQGCA